MRDKSLRHDVLAHSMSAQVWIVGKASRRGSKYLIASSKAPDKIGDHRISAKHIMALRHLEEDWLVMVEIMHSFLKVKLQLVLKFVVTNQK
jgi:hypothetical protein